MNRAFPNHIKLFFHGKGSRYFGIWAVNVIFTILTLGLYYPWAKAAMRQYIWNETEMDGDRFVFHGTGKEMFKGFIIAYGIIATMLLVSTVFPLGILLLYLGLILLAPIAIFGAWRYRLSRTSWRGIFFSFRGDLSEFLKLYFTKLFFTIITFGIYMPWMSVAIMKYLFDHSQMGQYKLKFEGEGGTLFGINVLGILLCVITLYIYVPWFIASRFNFTVNNVVIEDEEGIRSNLASTMDGGRVFSVLITNFLMVVFSFGIAFPWAIIRQKQLYIESVNIPERVDLSLLTQDADDYKDATGDDLVDILDMDFDF